MTTAKEAIERLKQRVAQREAGSVIVGHNGELHDPRDPDSQYIEGKKVKPIVHGDCSNGKLV